MKISTIIFLGLAGLGIYVIVKKYKIIEKIIYKPEEIRLKPIPLKEMWTITPISRTRLKITKAG